MKLLEVAAGCGAVDDVDDVADLVERGVAVEPDGDDGVLHVRQGPAPEGPDVLAVGLEQHPLDEGRVVHGGHAQRWKGFGISLGAGAHRLLERLLTGLVLLRRGLSRRDRLLARGGLRGLPLLGAGVEQDRGGADGERVDQGSRPVHLFDAGGLVKLPFEVGQADDVIGRDEVAPGGGLCHHHDRVGAEGVGEERLVLERRGVGVDEEIDTRVRTQARQSNRTPR